MSPVGKSGQRLLFPLLMLAIFATTAVIGGHQLAAHGMFDEPNNVLFEADCNRVVENTTSLWGEQGRARVHPLHVLLLAPVGSLLARVFGAQLVTVLITALAGAGLLYNVERILAEQLRLDLPDRALIVALLGVSASQITFTMVPDTHLLSAFALSGMARTLTPGRLERVERNSESTWQWLKAGGAAPVAWSVLGIGMLATNVIAVAVLHYLHGPSRFWSRIWRTSLCTAAALGVVFSLHLAQRKLWPPTPFREHKFVVHRGSSADRAPKVVVAPTAVGPRANAFSPPPPPNVRPADFSLSNFTPYVKWVWTTNNRFMTPPAQWPQRLVELLPQFFWIPFFAPRFGLTPKPKTDLLGATFEPSDFDFRLPGLIGLALGMLIVGRVLAAGGLRPPPHARPLLFFCVTLIGTYLFIVSWYGDEAFLFSPNWVFATVLTIAASYATALRERPQLQRPVRAALLCVLGLMIVNSALHIRDLFAHVG